MINQFEREMQARPLSIFGERLTANLKGIVHLKFPYDVNTRLVTSTVTGSGGINYVDGFAEIATSTTAGSMAMMRSKHYLDYIPGVGVDVRFTAIFTAPITGTTQLIGIGDTEDGLFFGYNGTSFGMLRRHESNDTWYTQTAWIGDTMDGNGRTNMTLNPLKLNVYRIAFQWLGGGKIEGYIEDTNQNTFQLVNVISFANQNTDTSFHNPSLPLCVYVSNTGTASNIAIKTPSMGGFLQGDADPVSVPFAEEGTLTGITATAETLILAIRNNTTYKTRTNKIQGQIKSVTVAGETSGNNTHRLRAYLNGTITPPTTTSWIGVDTAISSFDYINATGTTITNGILIGSAVLAKSGQGSIDLEGLDILLGPGETLAITERCNSTAEASASIAWKEFH